MAKIRLTSPTFNAALKTVTHPSFSDVGLSGINMIINKADNIIIYNFADPAKKGTLVGDVLTLQFDTTGMENSDELTVLVEDGLTYQLPSGAATAAKQDTLINAVDGLEALLGTIDADTGAILAAVDTIESLIGSTNTKLDTLITQTDGLETSVTAIESYFKNEDSPSTSGDKGLLLLAVRSSNDAVTTDADGDYTLLKIDEEGRLKVSSKPASYPDITGDITAIQATIGTPVAGGTVEGDVSRASNVMAFCTGTFSGVNCTFEGSLEPTGNANWFTIQAVRSNANTIETTTGALSAQPAYSWEMSVNALKRVRVRATARVSGTQSWRFVQGTYATEPIPAAQISGTQPVSGTVTATVTAGTVNPVVPATPYFLNSAATTNGALIIAGTSGVPFLYATNEGASAAYIKLYNKATAPTVGSDIPEMTIVVPAASAGVPGVANPNLGGSNSARFPLGLGIAVTRNAVFSDTTAIGAGEVKVKLSRTV